LIGTGAGHPLGDADRATSQDLTDPFTGRRPIARAPPQPG
jgi:hypothetical protein